MKVSIVIPAYNAEETIASCLKSVASQYMSAHEVLVVDDCSDDATAETALNMGATLIRCQERGGPAKARNVGVRAATGNIVVFLDADVTTPPDLVQKIVDILKSNPDCAAVQTVYTPSCPADNIVSRYQNLYYHFALAHVMEQKVAIFATWCAAVRKEDFNVVGGFNTMIPEPTVEDEELGYSLVDAGRSILLAKDIEVVHLASYTLRQFACRRFRMSKAQAKSGWRSIKERLLRRYINLKDTGTHHSRWVVLSILLVLLAVLSLAGAIVFSFTGTMDPSVLWIASAALVILALVCHAGFFHSAAKLFGISILPGFACLCIVDMAILGWGIITGTFLFFTGKHY